MKQQLSNEIVGLIHFVGVFVASLLAGQILGIFLGPLYTTIPLIASIISLVAGLVILYFAIVIVASFIKRQFDYSDSNRVVLVATFLNIIVSAVSFLQTLSSGSIVGVISAIDILISALVFYVVSKNNL